MKSRVTVMGHPLHPVLIVFPLGLLSTSVIFDVIHLFDRDGAWSFIAYYLIGAGIIGGIVAAVVGFLDWQALPAGTRAKQIGRIHAISNGIALILFAVSWFMRRDTPSDPDTLAFLLSLAGLFAASAGGYLGGELVFRLGVGVDRDPASPR